MMRVTVNDKLLATCNDPEGNFGQPINSTIKIFTTDTRQFVYSCNYDNFIGFSTDPLSTSSVITIIQSNKIQFIFKKNNNQVRKSVVGVNIKKLYIINFINPYLFYCEIINEKKKNDIYSTKVWHFNEENKLMTLHDTIENFQSFVFKKKEKKTKVYNATYLPNGFYLFAISYEDNIYQKNVTRIINENGEKVRDLSLDVYEVSNQQTIYYSYNNKLFIERESYFVKENAIFQFHLEDICNRRKKEIRCLEIKDIQQDNLNGVLNYVINNHLITSARITRKNGDILLKLKTLNYWI